MRENLFRGKRVDNGRWAYGFYEPTCVHTYFVYTPVIHETIGRHTGYSDKNGKWIFSGDIVVSGTYVGVVEFEKGAFVVKSNGRYTHKAMILKQAVWNIIGNIHDNPNLME